MNFKLKRLMLLACSAIVLVSCGPKKTDEAPAPEQKQESPSMELQKPVPLQPLPKHPNNKDGTLTPGQKEELEIDEDNVINPFPG
ncbi:MAG TPA: hypothetical protein VMW10_04940 [Alphaproteobacteria bacterium]|nr:hypothetical protein [Alphaproteobacteria bacterium]